MDVVQPWWGVFVVGMTELGGQRGRCETVWRCDRASSASLKLWYERTAVLGEKMLHVDTFATHQWHCLPGWNWKEPVLLQVLRQLEP
jgi:hypothetical protein